MNHESQVLRPSKNAATLFVLQSPTISKFARRTSNNQHHQQRFSGGATCDHRSEGVNSSIGSCIHFEEEGRSGPQHDSSPTTSSTRLQNRTADNEWSNMWNTLREHSKHPLPSESALNVYSQQMFPDESEDKPKLNRPKATGTVISGCLAKELTLNMHSHGMIPPKLNRPNKATTTGPDSPGEATPTGNGETMQADSWVWKTHPKGDDGLYTRNCSRGWSRNYCDYMQSAYIPCNAVLIITSKRTRQKLHSIAKCKAWLNAHQYWLQ